MPIAHFGDKLGSVDQMLCDEIGLSSRPIVISPGIHDSCCAAFCIPDSDPKWAFISSGSWSVVGMQTDCAIINEDGWRFNCSNSGMPMDSNMFKKLVAGMWVIQRCQKEWQSYSYSEIVELARAAKNDFHYIDPDAAQFYAPESMCKAISEDIFRRYGDEIAPNDAPRIARICFESLALKYRYTLDKLQMICARSIDKICILGGGSRNTLLNELSACACQLPVYTGVYEASVTGNLLVQLISCGEIENEEAAKDILRHSFTFQRFLPQDGPLWQQKYADFLRVLQEPVVN